jgi:hypothetical protein
MSESSFQEGIWNKGVVMNDNNASYKLTFEDAVEIWLRHWAGEFQNRIATGFDVNPGRVNEVLKERNHIGSREIALKKKAA